MGRHSSRDEAIDIIMDKLSKILTEKTDIEAILDNTGIFNLKKNIEEIKLHLNYLQSFVWTAEQLCYSLRTVKYKKAAEKLKYIPQNKDENQNKFKEALSKSVKEDNDVLKELANSNKT